MSDQIQSMIRTAISELIDNTISEKAIQKSIETHNGKIHFIPVQYRVLGGLLQSLNIRFGNFIEKLFALIVESDSNVSALSISGKKIALSMTRETDNLIDQYITDRQLPSSSDNCDEVFQNLLEEILEIEISSNSPKQTIKKDVDAIFQIKNGQIIYLEIKYNDDHDTGKFVDIHRKFLKTYAGLVNYLGVSDVHALKPILYYFNPVKRWTSIYVPSTNIYRGPQLFDEYFEIVFSDIDHYLRTLGDDEEIISRFDQLYKKIRAL